MTLKVLAKKLATPVHSLERETSAAYLEKRLHIIETELAAFATKHGVSSARQLVQLAKRGKVNDQIDALDDFFANDQLEYKRKQILALLQGI